jgi:hypothetical protein
MGRPKKRPARATVSKTVDVCGTSFTITAEPLGGGYTGRWVCNKCGTSGGSSSKFPSADAAIEGNKLNLGPHRCQPVKPPKISSD